MSVIFQLETIAYMVRLTDSTTLTLECVKIYQDYASVLDL